MESTVGYFRPREWRRIDVSSDFGDYRREMLGQGPATFVGVKSTASHFTVELARKYEASDAKKDSRVGYLSGILIKTAPRDSLVVCLADSDRENIKKSDYIIQYTVHDVPF